MIDMGERCIMVHEFLGFNGYGALARSLNESFIWSLETAPTIKRWFMKYKKDIDPDHLNKILKIISGFALFSAHENTWLVRNGLITGNGFILLDVEEG